MRNKQIKTESLRHKRSMRVRKKLHGSGQRPRLSVNKSNCHIQAQLIDDDTHQTIATIATFSKEFRNTEFSKKNKVSARKIGERLAEIAKEKNIKEFIFDRGPFKYHGILAELADGARSAGIKF